MSEKQPDVKGEIFTDHFRAFTDWVPTADDRHERALQLADPEYENEVGMCVPTGHQGYNFLLANWNSSEAHLKHTYYQLHELMLHVTAARLGETVIMGEPVSLSGYNEVIQKQPHCNMMEQETKLRIGRLRSDGLDYQYRSRLDKGHKGVGNVEPPYLLSAVRVQLSQVHDRRFDIGWSWEEGESYRDMDNLTAISLASTLEGDDAVYQKQHFTQATPILVGNRVCAEFLQKVEEEYIVDPDQRIADEYRMHS